MPPLSPISTAFNDVSSPSSPSVIQHSHGHGDVYSHFQPSISDLPSYGQLLPHQAYPHPNPSMQSHHSHTQQSSHIYPNNSFWAMNDLAAHDSYAELQPSTSPTSLALLHGTFYDSQHYQALVHAQAQAHAQPQAHFPTGGTLSTLLQSPLDIQHLPIGNDILPRNTIVPATNAFGGVASGGVSGSLDPETGIFSRTVEHPRLRTAQACEKCRIRKAKVRSPSTRPIAAALTPFYPTPSFHSALANSPTANDAFPADSSASTPRSGRCVVRTNRSLHPFLQVLRATAHLIPPPNPH